MFVLGAACFIIVMAYLALHPDHSWTEATGEPEHYAVPIEIEPVRMEEI